MSTAELRSWLRAPDIGRFPYQAVIREYHRVGKHFVPADLLTLLVSARDILPTLRGPWPQVQMLAAFLGSALDKPDQRYDYPSYLALSVLHLPGPDDPLEQAPFARSRCDRLTAQLVADVLAFELAAADGRTTLLPRYRPDAGTVAKRLRHGLRTVQPVLRRLSLDGGLTAAEQGDLVRQAVAVTQGDMSLAERQALDLSILPVDTLHDEYLFLRVLQAFETIFALLATQIRGAVAAIVDGRFEQATHFLASSESALRESAPLFSMLATMQVESFRQFRQYTDGASAIQSRNYKLFESLCRRPDRDRLDSMAYRSVPEVLARVIARQSTLDDAYRHMCDPDNRVTVEDRERVSAAMGAFARAVLRWRQTHYRLAVRMLGDAPGTGYTQGTPYLRAVRDIPLFHTVTADHELGKAAR